MRIRIKGGVGVKVGINRAFWSTASIWQIISCIVAEPKNTSTELRACQHQEIPNQVNETDFVGLKIACGQQTV